MCEVIAPVRYFSPIDNGIMTPGVDIIVVMRYLLDGLETISCLMKLDNTSPSDCHAVKICRSVISRAWLAHPISHFKYGEYMK